MYFILFQPQVAMVQSHITRFFMLLPLALNLSNGSAQNLVPNPSFEEYINCPVNFGQWAQVVDWTSPYDNSADYFNVCAGTNAAGVPLNSMGEQFPAEGSGYMGLFTYVFGGPSIRELISTQLSEPLQPGIPVYLCFKVAIGGYGTLAGNSANYTCSGVGMKFFFDLPADWNAWYNYLQPEYPNSAAIHLEEAITDTSVWVTVNGTYIPDSAYTHLVIGNFFDDSLSAPVIFDTAGYGTSNAAYVYIDQVSVSYDHEYCSWWTGVKPNILHSLSVGPNPFGQFLRVTIQDIKDAPAHLRLIDPLGRTMRNENWPVGQTEWVLNCGELASGYYTLFTINTQGASRSYALVHVSQ